jgi:CubicO group peptidase (beta-lactamase class C family)
MHLARFPRPLISVATTLGTLAAAIVLTTACQRAGAAPLQDGRAAAPLPPAAVATIEDSVHRVLDRGLADGAFPGAIAVVGRRDTVLARYAVGHLDWAAGSAVPDAHTLWDLASLTKVVGLTSGYMQLVAQGRIDLDAPVQRYLPAWTGPHKAEVRIRHLLTHSAGLPAFEPYDRITHDPDSLATLMFATPLDTVPGVRMVYSDIGAYLLGRVLERVSGQSLDQYLHDHVFEPAGMHETMYRPPFALRARIAPTEYDSTQRHRLVHGMVHDERAYYLGGVSAHAGLFSSASDLTRFAQMLMNGGTIGGVAVLPAAEIAAFTERAYADRALGWQKPDGSSSAGHLMPEAAYGHTGFTGTSIWIDPEDDVFIILLSNRVDPTRANNKIGAVRSQLADAVMTTILHPDRPSRTTP